MRVAQAHPDWVVGFEDEVWWSRLAQPAQHRWIGAGERTRLQELERGKDDPQAKALGYVTDATKADKSKFPKYQPGQHCAVCQLYQGPASAQTAGLFPRNRNS